MNSFYSKIVGSTFRENGQQLLSELKSGDPITWKREPENKYDVNAIALFNSKGDMLGYIPGKTAVDIAKQVDSGAKMTIVVSEVTGGGTKHVGCNIKIEIDNGIPEGMDATEVDIF